MTTKMLLELRQPTVNPSNGNYYEWVGGSFETDDENVWANTAYGVWCRSRAEFSGVFFVNEDIELKQDDFVSALILN